MLTDCRPGAHSRHDADLAQSALRYPPACRILLALADTGCPALRLRGGQASRGM